MERSARSARSTRSARSARSAVASMTARIEMSSSGGGAKSMECSANRFVLVFNINC